MPRKNEPPKAEGSFFIKLYLRWLFFRVGGVEKVQSKCKTQKCSIFGELDKLLGERAQPKGLEPLTF